MPNINAGDTAWVLTSTALVLFMTPGLAFFYGGMVRRKNVLGMLMQNYAVMGVVGIVWVWVTYSLAFGPDWGGHGIIGTLHFAGLAHVDSQIVPGYAGSLSQSIPPLVFVIFQMMFAVITVGLITGASADRLKFGGFVVFALVWSILVYAPVAHWVFSPTGWLAKRGVEDFAGGTVVHINAAMAALALAAVSGRRAGWPQRKIEPHNIPFILLGGGILWFGWFGFNAGSALGANNLSAHAFVNTNTAAAMAMLAWIAAEKLRGGKSTTVGAVCGAVAGLVAITPACGFVNLLGATVIGLIAGVVCYLAVSVKFKIKVDDSLDVLAVHFVGSSLGMLFVGLFGTAAIGGANGLFYGGGAALFGRELLAVVVVTLYSLVVSALIALAVKKTIGLRVSDADEELGLDRSQHGESAYGVDPAQP
ncbi:MAG: ammonium transporter, Amt family [Actinomycetota bacterium]|jgi:Amt family ammonium transporter|nr:ammonium transporter, Amt family [Actinomycetota bacterium]